MPSVVQQGTDTFYGDGSFAYTTNVTQGDFLCAVWNSNHYGGTPTALATISDNLNGSWQILDTASADFPGSYGESASFAFFNGAAAGGSTTVSWTAGGDYGSLIIMELSGIITTSPIIAHLASTDISASSGTFTTPAVTDPSGGNLVFGWSGAYQGTYTAGSGATQIATTSNNGACVALYNTASSASGSNTVNGAITGNNPAGQNLDVVGGTVILNVAGGSSGVVSITNGLPSLSSFFFG